MNVTARATLWGEIEWVVLRPACEVGFSTLVVLSVIADVREKASGVPKVLEGLGAKVDYKLLDVADYLTGGLAVERKSVRDFVSSVFDGRLFDQAYRLNGSYDTVVLIVEGDIAARLEDLKNPRWFWGGLSSAMLDYEMRCFFTPDEAQTAQLLYTLARHGAKVQRGDVADRSSPPLIVRKPRSGELSRVQVSIVSSLPGVGPKVAKDLLERFGTIRRVFEASATEMAVGAAIGRAKALSIRKLLDAHYKVKGVGDQTSLEKESEA